jgi:hypothetical protein
MTFSAVGKGKVLCCGFDVAVDGKNIFRGTNAWKLVKVESRRNDDGWTVRHIIDFNGRELPVEARITTDVEVLRIAWSMPGVERDRRGSPRFTYLGPGWFDAGVKRLYWGFGNVMENPVKFRTTGNGSTLPARHIGADFDGGISLVQACDVFPKFLDYHRAGKRWRLEAEHDATFTFVVSDQGRLMRRGDFHRCADTARRRAWIPSAGGCASTAGAAPTTVPTLPSLRRSPVTA